MFGWYSFSSDDFYRLEAKIDSLAIRLEIISKKESKIMAAVDNLKVAVAALADAVTSGTAEIEALLAKITAPASTDADVDAAAAQISAIVTALNDEVAKAKAVAP